MFGFGRKNKFEQGLENPDDIDKVPPPESYPEPMPGESDELPDTVLEEELIEEDEVEEIYREKPKQKERILISKEIKKDGIRMNEYTIKLKLDIDKIQAELEKETDVQKRTIFKGMLKDLKREFTELSGMAADMDAGNYDEITEISPTVH